MAIGQGKNSLEINPLYYLPPALRISVASSSRLYNLYTDLGLMSHKHKQS